MIYSRPFICLSGKKSVPRNKCIRFYVQISDNKLEEKIAASKDGTIYLNDTDMKTIIEVAQEEDAGKITVKDQPQIGANLDLKI